MPAALAGCVRHVGCDRIFIDRASGARDDRPELARVLNDVLRDGDTLVVWKLDRLARSLKKLIATAEDLARAGIGLVSLTESIDTTTPGGMLTRNGYDQGTLTIQLNARPSDVRAFLAGTLDPEHTHELTERLRQAGVPV